MKRKYYFDLDGTLWNTNSKIWIVDKLHPEYPILKIDAHEFNLSYNAYYIKDNNRIYYNGMECWLSNDLLTKIKQKKPIDLDRIGISDREFQCIEYLTEKNIINYEIDRIKDLNIPSITVLTARAGKDVHKELLSKLEEKLNEVNIKLDDSIFVNDMLEYKYKNNGSTADKKLIKMIQSLIGFEIHENKFVPLAVEEFDEVYFYDDANANIEVCNDVNEVIRVLYDNSSSVIQKRIEAKNLSKKKLVTHLVTTNKMNPFVQNIIELKNI